MTGKHNMPEEIWVNQLVREKSLHGVTKFECTFDQRVSPSNDTQYIRKDLHDAEIAKALAEAKHPMGKG